jgi:hypothetical protein
MRSSALVSLIAPLAIASVFLLASRPAHAQVLGVDLEGVTPVGSSPGYSRTGEAFGARLGYRFGLPLVSLTPEVGYSYVHLGSVESAPAIDVNRLFIGARLGFGSILVPSVYAHFGYGFVGTTNGPLNPDNGVTVDAGLALDLRVIPHFGFGIHGGYATVASSTPGSVDWVNYGVQADLSF